MQDERYKKIMEDLGYPNSQSLLSALKQVANEVAQEWNEKHKRDIAVIHSGLTEIANNTELKPNAMHEKAEEVLYFIRHGKVIKS